MSPLRNAVLEALQGVKDARSLDPRELTGLVQGMGHACHPSAVAKHCRWLVRRGLARALDGAGHTVLLSCPSALKVTRNPEVTPTFRYMAK